MEPFVRGSHTRDASVSPVLGVEGARQGGSLHVAAESRATEDSVGTFSHGEKCHSRGRGCRTFTSCFSSHSGSERARPGAAEHRSVWRDRLRPAGPGPCPPAPARPPPAARPPVIAVVAVARYLASF